MKFVYRKIENNIDGIAREQIEGGGGEPNLTADTVRVSDLTVMRVCFPPADSLISSSIRETQDEKRSGLAITIRFKISVARTPDEA